MSRLDDIQARLDRAAPGAITITPSDVAWLLGAARKQQATFSPANVARVVKATGLSIQTVNEVVRELRTEP